MSADRTGGAWQRLLGTVCCRYLGVFGGVPDGGAGDAAAVPGGDAVRLQLTVWEQRL
ncbi:hypothetical protein [Pseudarthrobacter sulfonivorans]|uniref:hypothetical protein n=1 Tax=Pseudarthrobacter sulfonivorans TaxID=121292 RepID=UPI00285EC9FC|nr:hypothetical protein [Pseudarthrobacter sulfonivorans]MDR6416602.1 hypothetical protein [Pseudarthrobacter sulfonivorans]